MLNLNVHCFTMLIRTVKVFASRACRNCLAVTWALETIPEQFTTPHDCALSREHVTSFRLVLFCEHMLSWWYQRIPWSNLVICSKTTSTTTSTRTSSTSTPQALYSTSTSNHQPPLKWTKLQYVLKSQDILSLNPSHSPVQHLLVFKTPQDSPSLFATSSVYQSRGMWPPRYQILSQCHVSFVPCTQNVSSRWHTRNPIWRVHSPLTARPWCYILCNWPLSPTSSASYVIDWPPTSFWACMI